MRSITLACLIAVASITVIAKHEHVTLPVAIKGISMTLIVIVVTS